MEHSELLTTKRLSRALYICGAHADSLVGRLREALKKQALHPKVSVSKMIQNGLKRILNTALKS